MAVLPANADYLRNVALQLAERSSPMYLCTLRAVSRDWRLIISDDLWLQAGARLGLLTPPPVLGPEPPQPPVGGSWRATFLQAERQQLRAALTDASVPWKDTPHYYSLETHVPGAISPRCLNLIDVCWLDLSTRIHGVLPGEYEVVWRMRHVLYCPVHLYARATALSNINPDLPLNDQPLLRDFDATGGSTGIHDSANYPAGNVQGQAGNRIVVSQPPNAAAANAQDPAWSGHFFKSGYYGLNHRALYPADGEWYQLVAGRVVVPEGCRMTVEVGMWNHGGDWKSGVQWDVVGLQRLPPAL